MRLGFTLLGCCACGSPSFCATDEVALGWDERSPLGFSAADVAALLGDVVRVDVTWGDTFSTTPPADTFWITLEPEESATFLDRRSNLPGLDVRDCEDELSVWLPARVESEDGGIEGADPVHVTASALDFDHVFLSYALEVTTSEDRRAEIARQLGAEPENVVLSLIHSRADFEQASIVAQEDAETYTTVWACAGAAECATWTLSASSE